MERLASLAHLPMQERSAIADALMPARNHGVVLSGIAASDNVSWAVGAFNNWIDSDESFSDTTSQLVGRVSWAPAVFQNESNLLHFGAWPAVFRREAAASRPQQTGVQQRAAVR